MKIEIANSIKYGRYKVMLPKLLRYINYLEKRTHRFYDYLNLPEGISILFRPIKENVLGYYVNERTCAEIDFRCGTRNNVSLTICHELIHAEQYNEGRLKSDYNNFYWRGKKWLCPGKIISLNDYYKQPWEAEANKRELKLFKKVFKTN